jgi:hypothetical protein
LGIVRRSSSFEPPVLVKPQGKIDRKHIIIYWPRK